MHLILVVLICIDEELLPLKVEVIVIYSFVNFVFLLLIAELHSLLGLLHHVHAH